MGRMVWWVGPEYRTAGTWPGDGQGGGEERDRLAQGSTYSTGRGTGLDSGHDTELDSGQDRAGRSSSRVLPRTAENFVETRDQGWNSQFCFWSQRIYNGGRICYISYVFMVPY